MFYEKVKNLCKSRGITIAVLSKDIGLSSGNGTNWKNGKMPKADTVQKIADYFSVPMDYLLSDRIDDKYYPLTENAQTLLDVFYRLDESRQLKLIGRLEFFALDSYADFFEIAKALKEKGLTKDDVLNLIDDKR